MTTKKSGIVHPKPTLTVIKQLYGTAFRCGEPECRKPLYRVNDDTGETILNSEVAHIHARSEGGPRWNSAMSSDDNRSPNNLMPLCFEHAWEIDQSEERFPADILLAWKAEQLAECLSLQKFWTLTDSEAEEVRGRSFEAREHGHAAATASTVMQTIVEVGVLIEQARGLRRGPAAVASEWRARRTQVNASSYMFDSQTGERVGADLGLGERRQFGERLVQALTSASAGLDAQVAKVKGLGLASSVDAELVPWCEWLGRAVEDVVVASARWPAAGAEDDDQLAATLERLRDASLALGRRARGEMAEAPPQTPAPSSDTHAPESETERRAREHREALEPARRWTRVDHLGYDAHVYGQVLGAIPYAVALPPFVRLLAFGLRATTRLAAKVARNADDETLHALIEEAKILSPLAASTGLLWDMLKAADEASRPEIGEAANSALVELLRQERWQTHDVWEANTFHCQQVLMLAEHFVSTDHVQEVLRAALEGDPTLIRPMLVGLAQWGESLDSEDWNEVLGVTCGIREIPSWVPREAFAQSIRAEMPDVVPNDYFDRSDADPERLGAEFLYQLSRGQGT